MLRVFICEDDINYLLNITKQIDSYIKKSGNEMGIVMSTQYPEEIIAILPLQNKAGLFFLDIDLNNEIDAFKLALKIREYDPRAFIVIVTGDINSHSVVFKHAIEIMDYIIKGSDDFNDRINACIDIAYNRYKSSTSTKDDKFTVKLAEPTIIDKTHFSQGSIISLKSSDIAYIESYSAKVHHVYFHMINNNKYLVRMRMKDVASKFGSKLIPCHVSCYVNKDMITLVDRKNLKIRLSNNIELDVGRRSMKNFY